MKCKGSECNCHLSLMITPLSIPVKYILLLSGFFTLFLVLSVFTSQTTVAQVSSNSTNMTDGVSMAQSNLYWKNFTSSNLGLAIEYPQTWQVIQKQNRFEEGPDITFEPADGSILDSNYASFSIGSLGIAPFDNVKVLANIGLKSLLDDFDVDYERRMIENVNTEKYVIDGEKAGSFTYVEESTDPDTEYLPGIGIEMVNTVHNGQYYIFSFKSSTDFFDTPEVTKIRQHMFNSIKWLPQTISKNQTMTEGLGSQNRFGPLDSTGQQPQIRCGQVIRGSVILTQNITCNSDGLTVDANNAIINLNGHSITGPGTHIGELIGIGISSDNVIIKGPGIIRGFQAGILATETNQFRVSSITLQGNEIGLFVTSSSGAFLDANTITHNNIGIASNSGTDLTMNDNLINNNKLAGISFVNTQGSNIVDNSIIGSQNGVFIDSKSTDNIAESNSLSSNTVDLNNANGLAPNVNQNTFSDNKCLVSNPVGLCVPN